MPELNTSRHAGKSEKFRRFYGERKANAGRLRNTVKTAAMPSNAHKMFTGKKFPTGCRRILFAANQMPRATAAAATLALIPIAREIFWGPMAYAMMGGIVVGTVLTLIFLPALYIAWFRIKEPKAPSPSAGDAVATS